MCAQLHGHERPHAASAARAARGSRSAEHASARASASAASASSSVTTGATLRRASTVSHARGMSAKRASPRRKAATAISLAALSATGAAASAASAAYARSMHGKRRRSARLERQRGEPRVVERGDTCVDAIGRRQRLRDRRAHVGIRQLREHRPVDIFDERVHDALPMDDDFDLRRVGAEQPVRLDDFESLVHHRRGVDRDLASHRPRRMRARLVGRHALEIDVGPVVEGAAGRRQHDAPHAVPRGVARIGRRQALDDGVVLAVDRKQCGAALGRCRP